MTEAHDHQTSEIEAVAHCTNLRCSHTFRCIGNPSTCYLLQAINSNPCAKPQDIERYVMEAHGCPYLVANPNKRPL